LKKTKYVKVDKDNPEEEKNKLKLQKFLIKGETCGFSY